MSRVNTPILSEQEKEDLLNGFKNGKTHCFRMCCHAILLKSQGLTSKEVGELTDMCNVSVNSWVKRYKTDGLLGLHTKSGRGRKPILNKEEDKESIKRYITDNRQRISVARSEWEEANDKSVSDSTFRRFLKSLAENTNQ